MINEDFLYNSITWLINALAIGILFQQNAPRLYAALVFSSIIYAHEYFMSSADGLLYYGSAALFDLIAVVILGMINPLPKMVLRLQVICMLFIFVNFAGWLLWFTYKPPFYYDLACAVLFAATLVALLLRDKKDVGGFTMDGWRSCFRVDNFALFFQYIKHEKKV